MLGAADRQQGFFDAAWCVDLLAAGSIYSLLAEHGERIVRDEDFAVCYSASQGRPSIAPSVLAKVLLLAYRDGLSDERAMEAVRFDLRWKVALGLPVDHPGFHPSSLVRFRARLLLHGKERLVFERSLELAGELGLIAGGSEQILDSTPMLGAAAVQDTAVLVRAAVRKLIDAVERVDKHAAAGLHDRLRFDYAKPRERPQGDWQDHDARMALLGEIARDAECALRAVETDEVLAASDEVAAAASLVREIIGQEFEVADEEGDWSGRREALAPRGVADWWWFPPAASSIRACGSPAHGSPTFFTGGIQLPGRRVRLGRGGMMVPLRSIRPMRCVWWATTHQP
jgi:transposase